MRIGKNISIRQRIYWSFSLLVFLFVANGITTLFTIHSNKKIAIDIFKVIAPSVQTLDDFHKILLESKTYTTNWVFLRSNQEDKKLLQKLHEVDYAELKSRINLYSSKWADQNWIDSLNSVYTGFEELLVIEKNIMNSLKEFEDYDDPVTKLEAERKVEEEIIPRTAALMRSLKAIHDLNANLLVEQSLRLERSSMKLRILIIVLTITIILAGFLLSAYMTRLIIAPINRIRHIINNLGKGIIQKISLGVKDDEIGKMILSVNNLSEKLEATASFAQEVGRRNFDIPFEPLSNEDTLGKSLIAMRNNIKSSDEKLNEAQHIARLGSWERNIETDEVTLTDEMYNIFDIDPLSFDYQFQSILKLIHPDDIGNVMETMLKNRLQAPGPIECRIATSKGVTKDILVETKMRWGKDGTVEETFGIVQDITERKKAKKELEVVNRELSILFNSIDEIFFSVNMTTLTVIQVSPSCEKLYGYKQSEFMDNEKLWIDIIHPDDKHVIENEDEIMRRGEQVNNQYRIIRKDKTIRWVETKITPTLDEDGKLVRVDGVTRDITERKKAEANLEIQNKELERKNKELEQFAYVASHDLQEPLRTITSFVKLLQEEYAGTLDKNADIYLNFITQSSGRMGVLIKDLFEYSRICHNKELEKVDCNKILQDVLADLDTAIRETQAIILSESLPVINGYPTEVRMLFQNLIANAIKFRKKDSVPQIEISVKNQKDCWEFAIRDNGIGIEKKHNDRIFIIFQRLHTRSEYNGSGIGLSHCKKIVELHNGKIWVESTPGEGSTFYFTIHS